MKAAFYQLTLGEESHFPAVFHANGRLMHYKKLTMGNLIVSGELSKALQQHFTNIKHVHLIQDDIVIAAPTVEKHDLAVEAVLRKAVDIGITFNPEKCIFEAPEVPFWGVIITKDVIIPDPEKIESLKNADRPRSKEELVSFLSMLQSNSEFIPGLAAEAYNLRQLTKKHYNFKWTDIHQKEFEKLKGLFHEKMLNQHYDPTKETFIFVDVHRSDLGTILAQSNSVEDTVHVDMASRATSKVKH